MEASLSLSPADQQKKDAFLGSWQARPARVAVASGTRAAAADDATFGSERRWGQG